MKTLSTILLGLSLLGFSCAEKITGPEPEVLLEVKTKDYRNYFDTMDVAFDNAVKARLSEIKTRYPNWEISPDIQKFNGQEYVLGFNFEGEKKTEITQTLGENGIYSSPSSKILTEIPKYSDLERDLDWIAGDDNYKKDLYNFWINKFVDGVDTPEIPEVLQRLEETNKSWKGIGFDLMYLKDKSGKIIYSDGKKMINGIKIYPKVSSNAGNSFMYDAALYIMTGEGKPDGGTIKLKIDTLKINLDSLKIKLDSLIRTKGVFLLEKEKLPYKRKL